MIEHIKTFCAMNLNVNPWMLLGTLGLVVLAGVLWLFSYRRKQGLRITKKDGIYLCMYSCYLTGLLMITLLNRTPRNKHTIAPFPFWSYWEMLLNHDAALLIQVIGNVAVFLPWGLLLPCLLKKEESLKYVGISAFFTSVTIEAIQAVGKLGLCEVDDVIHNTLGAVLGYVLYRYILKKNILSKKKGL